MSVESTNSSYWLNWRIFLCAVWILSSIVAALILIWKCEGFGRKVSEGEGEIKHEKMGVLYEDEPWKPCLRTIHPLWLLIFRVIALFIFVVLLVVNVVVDGGSILYYYTQWTFMLVTIYFGLGCLFSVYGCHQYMSKPSGNRMNPEFGSNITSMNSDSTDNHDAIKNHIFDVYPNNQRTAGVCGYCFQIIYQTSAGAILLTDFVFWLIIFPYLTINDDKLSFLLIGMHSINAIFFLGDTALNSLRFPWFRIGYFMIWSSLYVIFQWILHGCISIWWPYPFLDLTSNHAPLWYFVVAVLHLPCYALFYFLMKLKHYLLKRWCPQSYYILSSISNEEI